MPCFVPPISSHAVDASTVFDLSLHPNLKTLAIHDSSRADPEIFDPNPMLQFIVKLAAPTLECLSLDFDPSIYRGQYWRGSCPRHDFPACEPSCASAAQIANFCSGRCLCSRPREC